MPLSGGIWGQTYICKTNVEGGAKAFLHILYHILVLNEKVL